jgi:hypothetical protein
MVARFDFGERLRPAKYLSWLGEADLNVGAT